MKRVVFIVEGDTEISFIQRCLIPYLYGKGITNPMNAQKIVTNRRQNRKGGNVGFEYLKNDICRVAATGNVLITTFLDFFRLPTDFPSFTNDSSQIDRIEEGIKRKMSEVMDVNFLLPYIQRHEIEALMFSDMDGFDIVVDDPKVRKDLKSVIDEYPNPEDINSSPEKAPSKRLLALFPYEKTLDGEMILEALSIDKIRSKCPRFNDWLEQLESGIKDERFY